MNPIPIKILLLTPNKKDEFLFESYLSYRPHPYYQTTFVCSLEEFKNYSDSIEILIIKLTKKNQSWFEHTIDHSPHLPIIVVVDKMEEEERDYVLKKGAQTYISKELLFSNHEWIWYSLHSAIIRQKKLWDLYTENQEYKQAISALKHGKVDALLGQNSKGKGELFAIQKIELVERNRRLMERLEHLVNVDYLTQVPNRLFFEKELHLHIRRAKRYHYKFALFLIDVDHFKTINDTLGHTVGDLLLKALVQRLQTCLRQNDLLVRLGGDEFAIILDGIKQSKDVDIVARKILKLFVEPFELEEHVIRITVSMGIAFFPESATNATSLLKAVDVALYEVKNLGRNNYKFYKKTNKNIQTRKLELESALHLAIQKNEFHMVYQPIVDLKTQEIIYLEALLRWTDSHSKKISPAEFIPIAEACGIVPDITNWVINEVGKQIALWKESKNYSYPVAINLSFLDILNTNLTKKFKQIMKRHMIDPSLFQVEITETSIMSDQYISKRKLKALQNLGIKTAIDDFGTGFSSLSRLQNLPIDVIKIDRSFITHLLNDSNSRNIVAAIIALAKRLEFKVLAEGVEKKEQADFLVKMGCDYAQGFYFHRPITAKRITKLIPKRK